MTVLNIPIPKAGGRTIEVDTSTLPDEMYEAAMREGLKVLLTKGMSTITTAKLEGIELAKARDAAFRKAEENRDNLLAGKLKIGRGGAKNADGTKVPGVVMTEARRLAKEVVKNQLREANIKISHVEASEITKAANALLASDPSYIETAQKNIEERSQVKPKVDITTLVHVSPKLVAKADKAKAERKQTLSAKQAGKVAPRKGQAPSASLQ